MYLRVGRAALALAVLSLGLLTTAMPVAQAADTYRVQLDAKPPAGDNWSFLRFFPAEVTVHQGDVIDAAWAGAGAPHTATLVPSADANAWRETNQGTPGPQDPSKYPYALQVLDTAVGGDDGEAVLNPAVAGPSNPACGTETAPCTFDGTKVVSSGFLESNPSDQPDFFVQVNAPAGTYSFVCLLHPGMQETVKVVAAGATIPSPQDVAAQIKQEVKQAKTVDGVAADAQAQRVTRKKLSKGHTLWTMWAGGFSNGVTADEFPSAGLKIHEGDKLKVLGNYEIHTATFPFGSIKSVPFILPQCEVTGPDSPAASPADCSSPTKFELVFNAKAVTPTKANALVKRSKFVNSGLLTYGTSYTFPATKPGEYRMICLVHGPMMSTTVTVT